jgi:hypothetical protein
MKSAQLRAYGQDIDAMFTIAES